MPKRLPDTKARRKLLADHDAFLRKMGIAPDRKPRTPRLAPDPLSAERHRVVTPSFPTSDKVGNGFRKKFTGVSTLPVAQPYHKGPLMVVTDYGDLAGSRRRD